MKIKRVVYDDFSSHVRIAIITKSILSYLRLCNSKKKVIIINQQHNRWQDLRSYSYQFFIFLK